MRPSKLKTPLAKLRAMITIRTADGHRVKLSRQDVAEWLGCGVDNISSIESGRVKLTHENAEIILAHTHANLGWLLGINKSPFPVNFAYRKFTQKDFDDAQINLARPTLPALKAQYELASSLGIIATILLNAVKKDRLSLYASRLRHKLYEIASEFPPGKDFVNLSHFIDTSHGTTVKGHDFRPLLKEFERQLLQIVNAKSKT